jgi:hypothetical protein
MVSSVNWIEESYMLGRRREYEGGWARFYRTGLERGSSGRLFFRATVDTMAVVVVVVVVVVVRKSSGQGKGRRR